MTLHTLTAANPAPDDAPPVAYLDGYIDAHFEDPDVIVTRIDWAREYDLDWADHYAAGTIAAHRSRGARHVTVDLRKKPAQLPTRTAQPAFSDSGLTLAEQAAVDAAQYVAALWWQEDRDTPVRVIDWRGGPHGATAPISERAALVYTPGGEFTSLTVRALCGFGVWHEQPVLLPRDLDAALTAAESCTAHADPHDNVPGVDDLAILRLLESSPTRARAVKETTNA